MEPLQIYIHITHQCSSTILMITSIKHVKKKYEAGEPCLTPIAAVTIIAPKKL